MGACAIRRGDTKFNAILLRKLPPAASVARLCRQRGAILIRLQNVPEINYADGLAPVELMAYTLVWPHFPL